MGNSSVLHCFLSTEMDLLCKAMPWIHAFARGNARYATGVVWKMDKGMGTEECSRAERDENFSALIPMSPFPCHFQRPSGQNRVP